LTVYDTLDGTCYVEKGSDVNRRPCLMRKACCVCAIGALAVCLLLLARGAPVQAAVHLAYFEVTGREDDVLIEWGTGMEETTYGFELYRAEADNFGQAMLIHTRDAENFGQFIGAEYVYADGDVELAVTYYYWLVVLDLGGETRYGPKSATPGPPPTSTPPPTPTGTRVPTATSIATLTKTPMPTSTNMPTVTPSFTATGVPTSTPTGTPTTTPVLPPPSSPSSTSVVEQRLSPTATLGGIAQPTLSPAAAATEWTPMPTSTAVAGAAETSTATPVAWGGDSEPGATGWSSFRLHWSTIQPSTILLLVSLMSLLGVLLLSVALALVRKLSL
jgi:hypothetical protein